MSRGTPGLTIATFVQSVPKSIPMTDAEEKVDIISRSRRLIGDVCFITSIEITMEILLPYKVNKVYI